MKPTRLRVLAAGIALLLPMALRTSASDGAKPTFSIVAFGDSTTAPRLVEGKELAVYSDLLATNARLRARGVKIINAGVPGNTTRDARARFAREVLGRQPALAIIQFGINDATVDVWQNPPRADPRVPLAEFTSNLAYFISELRRHEVQAVLMTPNPLGWTEKLRSLYGKPPYHPENPDGLNPLLKQYAEAVRKLAEQTQVPLIDVYSAFENYASAAGHTLADLLLDGMHPNEQGHRLIADLLGRQLAFMSLNAPPARLAAPMNPSPSGIAYDSRATWRPDFKMGPFVRLGNGSLLTVDGSNALLSADEGKTWRAHPIFADPAKFEIRPERALIRTRKGVVILAFLNDREKHWTWQDKLGDAPDAVLPTCVVRSTDEGLTWEPPQTLHRDWSGCVRNVFETRSGRIVFTAMKMLHHPGRHAVLTYSSDDQGRSWKASNVIDLGGAGHHGGVTEAAAVELKDGRLLQYIRTNWGHFWRAESKDGGLNWHPFGPTDVAASSAPAWLQRLASGRIILIWNRPLPEGKSWFPLSGGDRIWSATPVSNHRGELSLAFSEDECETWSQPVVIARQPGASLAYPYLFEAWPGELWLTTMQGGVKLAFHESDFLN